MSGIAGLIYPDNRPASLTALDPALEAMRHLGPDGVARWAEGSAALAHLALHTTPEALHERWPLRGARGAALVADARLDNRDELLRALRPPTPADRPPTDAELILAAHERWGDAAPARLLGDFAYALWEPETRTLRLVRSPFGLRGLFYRVERDRVLFASTLAAIRALEPRGHLNVPWVASFFAQRMDRLWDETVVQEVRKVPPAHGVRLDVGTGTERRERFWDLTPSDDFAGWRDDDWVQAFRERFETAVAAALRSQAPIAMSVSGGMDSSAIALVAHRWMHEARGVPARPVHTFTQRMPGWPATDEDRYQDAVLARLPCFHQTILPIERAWDWATVEAWQPRMNTPSNFPNAFMWRSFFEAAREAGCRAKLSGIGGDIVTGSESYYLWQTLDALGWREGAREFPFLVQANGSASRVLRLWLREQVPPKLLARWRSHRPAYRLPTAVCDALADTAAPVVPPIEGIHAMQRLMREVMLSPFYLQPFEQRAEIMALHGLELRCPFYDRRLVELSFNLPLHLRAQRGRTRVAFKEALADTLPPLLFQRDTKADFGDFSARSPAPADIARARALAPDALVRRAGWLNEALWHRWTTAPTEPRHSAAVYRVAHLDQWLREQARGLTGEKLAEGRGLSR